MKPRQIDEVFITDKELDNLNKANDDGELPFCEEIEKLINKYDYCFEVDDFGVCEHHATIGAMWDLQRASQVHDWNGFEDQLYFETKRHLLHQLDLEYDGKLMPPVYRTKGE